MPTFNEPVVANADLHSTAVTGTGGTGVTGTSQVWLGVLGETHGTTNGPAGVWGHGHEGGSGVKGHTNCKDGVGVGGFHLAGGAGIYGEGSPAGRFKGNVEVKGALMVDDKCHVAGDAEVAGALMVQNHCQVAGNVVVKGDIQLPNEDCAEDFDIVGAVQPGTVMVVSENGALRESHQSYDKRVAGVIAGAGSYRPGIVLGKRDTLTNRLPIGLLGKVYCKVDAESSPIEVGDLLTTSCTPGHAMKAGDPFKSFGAVLGKALSPLKSGQGLIPILISLQ
jgi:hypothetical protein